MSDVPVIPVVGSPTPVVPVTQEPVSQVPQVPPAGNPPRLPEVPQVPAQAVPAPVEPQAPIASDVTGNEVLDTAISTFVSMTGATNADMQRATANALAYGDPALVDVAFLKEKFGKFGDQAVALAKAAVSDSIKQTNDASTAALSVVNAAAGGEANWKQAVSVFNSTASPTIKEAVKALMNQGNVAGGAELLLSVVNGSGLLPNVNPSLNGGGAVQGGSNTALNAQQFQTELAALSKEAGNRSLESGPMAVKYNQLIARRSAGKALGM
jgi:hypothetical protein